jgi:hypothetical protein
MSADENARLLWKEKGGIQKYCWKPLIYDLRRS